MNIIKTEIQDVLIFEPEVYEDERGFFMESFNQRILEKNICKNVKFVQDNHSKSMQGVLRGLHYQLSPFAQGKLVRCTVGRVFDVAVDLEGHLKHLVIMYPLNCRQKIKKYCGFLKALLTDF